MLKKMYQSPFFNIALIVGFGLAILSDYYGEKLPDWLYINRWYTVIPIFLVILIVPIHNLFAKKENRVKPQLLPMELREEDEGMRWVMSKATRKVYVFFVFAVPLSAILAAKYHHIVYLPVIIILFLGIMQYLIFWYEVRKYHL
ncbi:hypothetical protein [Bacillus sp. FJAT-52991]|uniref:MFS transporter n=1 Tax=Bacillus kandeliae TaxID=3129297 RepID=A0ABZ2N6R0_9BACI